ncbi:unnamed protein product [Microthlaspi erraticum]|uniref:Uncharacterized protein n=1 Tax=Microthlaspi erraticum TaxID=1685480 RepID=A0A6D2I016_9BRAS|nr:unnamed protein product [Microthlaspi erraticum]
MILAEQISSRADHRSSRERNGLCSAGSILSRDRNRPRETHGQRGNRPRSAGFMYRNGPTVPVDPGSERSASAEISRPYANLADQITRPRQNLSVIGPNFSRPR